MSFYFIFYVVSNKTYSKFTVAYHMGFYYQVHTSQEVSIRLQVKQCLIKKIIQKRAFRALTGPAQADRPTRGHSCCRSGGWGWGWGVVVLTGFHRRPKITWPPQIDHRPGVLGADGNPRRPKITMGKCPVCPMASTALV